MLREDRCNRCEMFRSFDEAAAGDNIGCLLRGIQRDEVQRGQVLQSLVPLPHTHFKGQVYVLPRKRAEGIPILQWLQAAVLFQDNRRHRCG